MAQDHFDPDRLTEVFSCIDPMRVKMAYDLLDGSGISAFIFDGDMSRMLGSTAAVPARLMVYASDLAEARERLRDLGFNE
jgi:Putative prokaryotic signal transducing protein